MINGKKCVLIADDEEKMVRALSDLFRAKGFEVIKAYDGKQALDEYCKNNTKVDIVLLDVMMPEMDGFEVADEIRRSASLVPIILITARGEEYDQLKGFSVGVDDYVSKPFSPSVLLARVDALLRRVGNCENSIITVGNIKMNSTQRTVEVAGENVELTRREYELLYFLIINKGMIFTREQLLNNVWGYDFDGSLRTVDTHIKQLRIKLGDESDHIRTVHCVGYEFCD